MGRATFFICISNFCIVCITLLSNPHRQAWFWVHLELLKIYDKKNPLVKILNLRPGSITLPPVLIHTNTTWWYICIVCVAQVSQWTVSFQGQLACPDFPGLQGPKGQRKCWVSRDLEHLVAVKRCSRDTRATENFRAPGSPGKHWQVSRTATGMGCTYLQKTNLTCCSFVGADKEQDSRVKDVVSAGTASDIASGDIHLVTAKSLWCDITAWGTMAVQ